GQRRSRLGESGSATTHASRQCPAVLATGSPQQSDPSRMQGGWPEPAMDGRRPELEAGQRRFRLVIPPASAAGTAPPHPAPRKLEMNPFPPCRRPAALPVTWIKAVATPEGPHWPPWTNDPTPVSHGVCSP